MRGDFTRLTFKPQKRFSKVMMQQGRVQLDQDWNEQMEILARRWELQTRDMIGSSGVPVLDPGLGVTFDAQAGRLLLSPGRVYVDGLLCEALPTDGAPLSLGSQPFAFQLDGAPPLFALPAQDVSRTDLVYMKAWERHVGAVEDADLLDPALGGVDTATRTQTVWQVLAMAVPDGTTAESSLPAWDALTAAPTGRLSTKKAGGSDGFAADGGGYRGLENRLYRVEIHEGGDQSTARFKWSRDNGSVAVAVTEINKQYVTVLSLGRDQFTSLAPGQWVEVIDDEHEFMQGKGLLAQIKRVVEADGLVELTADVSAINGSNPRLRRWDMVSGPVSMTGDWQELELGVQVQFHTGTYRPGDYWTFAARAATADVEERQAAAPEGVAYRYYKLALVRWNWVTGIDQNPPTRLTCQIDDLRYHFPALAFPKQEVPPHNIKFVPAGADFGLRLQQAAQALTDGGCLMLPEGYITLERPVRFENLRRITICGVEGGATRLLYTAADPTLPALDFAGCADVTLDSLCVYGKAAHALVRAEETNGLHVTGCRLVNFDVDGVAIWSGGGLSGLAMEDCTVVAGAGVVALDLLSGVFLHRTNLHCYRAGLLAKTIGRLEMQDCRIDFAGDRLGAVTALTAAEIASFEQATFVDPANTITLPLGLFALDGEHWRLHNVQITAGMATGAYRLTDLNLNECQFTCLTGVFAVQAIQFEVHGCRIRSLLSGAALMACHAQSWRITENNLTGLPWAIRLGPIGQDVRWISGLLNALQSGVWHLTTPADFAEAGPGVTIPALTKSTWLVDALAAIFKPERISRELVNAGNGWAQSIEVRSNRLSGVALLEECGANQVSITENEIETSRLTSLWLMGFPGLDGHVQVTSNQIQTGGVAVSSAIANSLIAGNLIQLTAQSQARQDLLAVGNALQGSDQTAQIGRMLFGVSGEPFRAFIAEAAAYLASCATNGDPDAAEVQGWQDGFQKALAAYKADSPEKRLNALFLQQVSAKAWAEAGRTLSRWGEYMAVGVLRPSIRCSAHGTSVEENVIKGDDSAGGSILLELATNAPTTAVSHLAVCGNRFRGAMRSHGVIAFGPIQDLVVERNQMAEMGGIMLYQVTDVTVSDNRVDLAATPSDQWFRHQCAIALEEADEQVSITGNQVRSHGHGALYLAGARIRPNTVITGNQFVGYKEQHPYFFKVDAQYGTAVIAQNHVTYQSRAEADAALMLTLLRASVTGNVITEMGVGVPITITADSYAIVGNMTLKPIPESDSPIQTVQNNARSRYPYPGDPQITILAPAESASVSGVVQFQISALDRNAESAPGVDWVRLLDPKTGEQFGEATYDSTKNVWTYNWDLVAANVPYGARYVRIDAHSAVRDAVVSKQVYLVIAKAYPTDPVITITSPANATTIDPGNIQLRGTASDRNASGGNGGIRTVEVYLDGDATTGKRLGTAPMDTSGGWVFLWQQSQQPLGTHTLYAVATSNRDGQKAVARVTLTVRSAYPSDPTVTITSPAANQTLSGSVQVKGQAYDRNAATAPGVDQVKLQIKEGTSTTPRDLGAATILTTAGDWSYAFDTNQALYRDVTLVAAAHSVPQGLTRTTELPVKVDFPGDPSLGLTFVPDGFTFSYPNAQAGFSGWALDRRSTAGHGIQRIDVYQQDDAGALTLVGTCTLDQVSPVSTHTGTRFANCGFNFYWSPFGTGGTGGDTMFTSLSGTKSSDTVDASIAGPRPLIDGGEVQVTFVFRATATLDGKTTDQVVNWYYFSGI